MQELQLGGVTVFNKLIKWQRAEAWHRRITIVCLKWNIGVILGLSFMTSSARQAASCQRYAPGQILISIYNMCFRLIYAAGHFASTRITRAAGILSTSKYAYTSNEPKISPHTIILNKRCSYMKIGTANIWHDADIIDGVFGSAYKHEKWRYRGIWHVIISRRVFALSGG